MRRRIVALALLGLAWTEAVRAQGIMIPVDPTLPLLQLKSEHVEVTIVGRVATTRIEQVYHNRSSRALEAEYLLPTPRDAAVSDFAMWVNGKRLEAEAFDNSTARQTYEGIVSRLKDPGLVEWVGRDLWKLRIYPVPAEGDQKISLSYVAPVPFRGGLATYEYRLRNGRTGEDSIGDFSFVAHLRSDEPLGSILSPSHRIAVERTSAREAEVRFEKTDCPLDQDLHLAYSPSSGPAGFGFQAYCASPGVPGYFMMTLAPGCEQGARRIPRDVVLVVDTSRSMAGGKLQQAREAILRVLETLSPDDRFAVVAFASRASAFRRELTPATEAGRQEPGAWIDALEAGGGTNLQAALEEAFRFQAEDAPARPLQVLLMTDGQPTVGETRRNALLYQVRKLARPGTHLYPIGLGEDVDPVLLDQIASATQGRALYVRGERSLEDEVASLAQTLKRAYRTDLELEIEGVATFDVTPQRLPDLFEGEELVIAGRYRGAGSAMVRLRSRAAGHASSESFTAGFPSRALDNDFIATIWANRRVGALLDQARESGSASQARREITQLARDFGIATPFTSFLVAPGNRLYESAVARRSAHPHYRTTRDPFLASAGSQIGMKTTPGVPAGTGMMGGMGGMGAGFGGMGGAMGGSLGGMGGAFGGMGGGAGMALSPDSGTAANPPENRAGSGKQAIDLAEQVAAFKSSNSGLARDVRTIAGRRFRKAGNYWVDQTYKPRTPIVHIRFLGKAYFALAAEHHELGPILALGREIIWVSPSGKALMIDTQGDDDMPGPAREALFVPIRP